ncbi:nidogen [Pectinophora gossypiella]|uniref:nidogen n=1 Tax=Pectinophora gossypiella TaxID=13191 RepID=UPI00214F19E3|nr:nidogen [Pectinophora gossypiella]
MWTCAVVLALCASAGAITRDQFYPNGAGLDQRLPRGAEVASPELRLRVPIVFYGETYETVFVNNYGVLSFRADIPSFLNSEFPLPYPSIAAFYSNIDTTESGTIYYRETDEPHVLSKAEESVQNNFHEYYDFVPTSVFIATWLEVSYTERPDRKNSFQIAVISNGNESFVELLYPEREIQWIQREAQQNSLPDAKAQAGFVAEDGRVFTLRGSGSHQIRNIVSWSNTHEPGKYVFRVGNIPSDGNIADPDQYDQNEVEVEEESKTCAQSGPSVCHIQARCVDYQAGICCQCNEGFYGNGKSCIKDDVPIRVHGKLNGIINDVSLNDVDIQAYVVVADGRSYTALSQGPPSLGSSLQLLNVLGGVVGWLFAKPSGTAQNGYQLTGALFNHTADILFPATGDRVVINQEYLGHDVFDQIALETDVRGTVPVILSGSKLEISEYEEQYTTVEPGLVRSEANRVFTNKITGERYEQKISQTFTFNPCRFAPPSKEDSIPSTLKVVKNYLGYETNQNIIRYGMSNKIIPFGQEDPCIKGRNSCGPHSTCVVQGDSFTCVCQTGFTSIYIEDAASCVDIDECAAGTNNCDSNADCYNHDGGFQCRCKSGYEGNGVNCNRISLCRDKNCDPNAQCVENFGEAPLCVCNPGFRGDGQTCWPEQQQQNPCERCSPYAYCAFDSNNNGLKCQCNEGYHGDGLYCTEIVTVQTTTSSSSQPTYPYPSPTPTQPSTSEADYNETIVLPNCDIYGCVCPPGYSSYKDDRNNDLCRLDSYRPPYPLTDTNTEYNDTSLTCDIDTDCPPNAVCYKPFEIGQCICPEGYEGDAYECIERTGSCACGVNGHCIDNAAGEPMCVCDVGYHGDGYSCRPNFSCTNNSDCEYHAECRPDLGSGEYVCQCIEGYIKDQNDACIPGGQLCSGAVCVEHASCLYDDKIGVSYCHCDPGYEGEGIAKCVPQGTTCKVTNDCHPKAVCTLYDNTYQCICNDGYIGDGYHCTPEANCRNNPYMCDIHASCLKRSDVYVCECNTGYNGNGSVCVLNPRQSGNFLIASDGASVYRVPFRVSPRDFATPINSAIYQIAVGIDVDCETGRIYWGDVVGNAIRRAAYDGSGFDSFLSNDVKSPEGVSIDWSARNIFWTDSKKLTIEVANLDTKLRKVLFSRDGITNPRGIVVHPQRGKVFWSDWNRAAPKIEWANMDGTQRGIFLDQSDVKLPNSLAIDWSRDRLCYADAGLFSIRCVGIDNLQRETIADGCSYPFGLAINGNTFYWTDWKTLKIEYVDTLTQLKGQVPISTASRRLYGVAVAPDQCPGSINVCQYRNGNCEADQLCLPDGRGGRTCVVGERDY